MLFTVFYPCTTSLYLTTCVLSTWMKDTTVFWCGGDRIAVTKRAVMIIIWYILNSPTGAVMCSADDGCSHSIQRPVIVDDGRYWQGVFWTEDVYTLALN
jgi:hypothetical protein